MPDIAQIGINNFVWGRSKAPAWGWFFGLRELLDLHIDLRVL